MTGPATYARIADDLRSGSEPVRNEAIRLHLHAIIEALEIASAAGAEPEWIEWSGGQSPIGPVSVEIKMRNGDFRRQYAHTIKWEHDLSPFDVVAYRLGETK